MSPVKSSEPTTARLLFARKLENRRFLLKKKTGKIIKCYLILLMFGIVKSSFHKI